MWKLKRELGRVAEQISAIPLLVFEPIRQIFYDHDFDNKVVVHYGQKTLGRQVAIFLIYQPAGLMASTYLTIDHLVESGFDPVVVSNCSLSVGDIERLKEKSSLVIERENFGYDFGGYRDAVWLLRKHKVHCDSTLFLNDSVWFPVFNDTQMLREMIEADAEYVGTQAFGETTSSGIFDGFFGSYCFLIKKPLLYSAAFSEYWDNYRLSSSKEIVLRRGERRFSRKMLEASNKSIAIYSYDRFVNLIAGMCVEDTRRALEDLIVWDDVLHKRKIQLLQEKKCDDHWVADAKMLIILLSKSKNFIGSSPVISLTKLGFPMIKKNKEMLYTRARQTIVESIDSGRISGLNQIVENELRQKVSLS